MCLLLMNDNFGDILLTKKALNQGIIVRTISEVKDNKVAIKYLEKVAPYTEALLPDLIVLNINLPEMNGYEFSKNIMTNNYFKQIPVVLIITSSKKRERLDAYKNYANYCITKINERNDSLGTVTLIENLLISIVHLPTTNHPIK